MVDIKEEAKIDAFLSPDVEAVSKAIEEEEDSGNEEITGVKGISMNPAVTRDGLLSKTTRRKRREHKQMLKAIEKKKDLNKQKIAKQELIKVRKVENAVRRKRIAKIKV